MTIKFTFAAGGAGKITNSSERSPSGKPKVKRKIQLSILSLLFFNAAFFSPLLWRGAGGEALAQALWQPSGTSSIYTMRKVGVNTSNPLYPLDVKGNVHSSNATFDSSATAMKMIAQQAQFATAVVTGNLSVAGAVSAGSLSVNGNAVISGQVAVGSSGSQLLLSGNTITSSTGNISFNGNNLTTTGNISAAGAVAAGSLSVNGNAVIGNQLSVNGNATINGQLSTNTITSSSGAINFGNTNLSTTGNVNSTNISALQASDSVQQSKLSALSSQIASIPQSQWSTNSDGSISYNGSVTVQQLNATDAVNIGSFRFSNGGINPQPIVIDSIRTPFPMSLSSGANQISLAADTVKVSGFVSFSAATNPVAPPPLPIIPPPLPVPGVYGQLNIFGNVAASGDISSNTLTSNSIVTSQLTINGGSMNADTLHAYKQLSVNHSLLVSKETQKNYAEVSTIDTSVALVLQKDTLGRGVGIGTTPFLGERLSVAGNVGVSGNINANCVTTSCLNVSGKTQFDSLRVLKKLKIGAGSLIIENNPVITSGFPSNSIYTDNQFSPPVSNDLFIQSTSYINNTIINANNTGNVGVGTTIPDGKMSVLLDAQQFNIGAGGENTRVIIRNSLTSSMGIAIGGGTNNGVLQGVFHTTGGPPGFTTQSIQMQPIGGNVGIAMDPGANMKLEVKGSVSIYDGSGPNINGNGDNSLFFGREQTNLQNQIAADYGEWGIQYWWGGSISLGGTGTNRGGLNFWKPSGSDFGYGNHGFANGVLFLADDGSIGINTYDPHSKLEIIGNGNTSGTSSLNVLNSNNTSLLYVQDNGRVGMGTTTPSAELEISSSGSFNNGNTLPLIKNTGSAGAGFLYQAGGSSKLWAVHATGTNSTQGNEKFVFHVDSVDVMTLTHNGASMVGINCTNPQYQLDVSGTARAKEFRVSLLTGCDFVFEENYPFLSLSERKIVVLKQKHLLNVASAKEMQQGTSLGETMMGILQNVEEHEHYLYQHDDRIEKLEKEIEALKAEIEILKKK